VHRNLTYSLLIHKSKVRFRTCSCVIIIESMNLVDKFDPVKQMRTHPSLINRRSNRLTIEQLKSTKLNLNEQDINVC
jgi:hypothetical protein